MKRYKESIKIAKDCLEWIEKTIKECEEKKNKSPVSGG